MNIVHIGCSFSRGYYGHAEKDPNDPLLNLVDIIAKSYENITFYNFSLYVSSIETQCAILKHLLRKKEKKIDAIIWQVTTASRLGFVKDRKRFYNKVDYDFCRAGVVPNALTLLQNSCNMNFDPWYATCFLNPGIVRDKKANWRTKTFSQMMQYGINSVGTMHNTESSMANIYYMKKIIEKQKIPILIFPWLSCFDKIDTLDCFDFVVENEIDFSKTWHDHGHHFGPTGMEMVKDLVSPFIEKI